MFCSTFDVFSFLLTLLVFIWHEITQRITWFLQYAIGSYDKGYIYVG